MISVEKGSVTVTHNRYSSTSFTGSGILGFSLKYAVMGRTYKSSRPKTSTSMVISFGIYRVSPKGGTMISGTAPAIMASTAETAV
ncbi:hypothetical protein [Eubacterium sp.]|uniref:hypothetical protein n=1 Tax=Eubacterium sp. TaxID=142586 RepID=UPI0030D8951F